MWLLESDAEARGSHDQERFEEQVRVCRQLRPLHEGFLKVGVHYQVARLDVKYQKAHRSRNVEQELRHWTHDTPILNSC